MSVIYRLRFSLALALTAMTGCATTQGNLPGSAHKLERRAATLGSQSRDEYYGSATAFERDSRDLANQAHGLREALAERRDSQDVKSAFERVSLSYRILHEDVDRADDRLIKKELRPVTEAYLAVEREMGSPDAARTTHEN